MADLNSDEFKNAVKTLVNEEISKQESPIARIVKGYTYSILSDYKKQFLFLWLTVAGLIVGVAGLVIKAA